MAKAARDFLKINGKPDKNGNVAEGKKAITWEDIGIEPTEEIDDENGGGKRKIKPTDPIGWGIVLRADSRRRFQLHQHLH